MKRITLLPSLPVLWMAEIAHEPVQVDFLLWTDGSTGETLQIREDAEDFVSVTDG
jgi:hypothetical protein